MSVQIERERHALLCRVSALGLAVYDAILYLDTHNCPDARKYLEEKKSEYAEALAKYEECYGPINVSGHPDTDVVWCWQLV